MSKSAELLIRPLHTADLTPLKPILEHWIKDSMTGETIEAEVTEVLESMRASVTGRDRHYLVAEQNQLVLGDVGLATPGKRMREFCLPNAPTIELMNLYVGPENRGKGVRKALFNEVGDLAASLGYDAMIWNSDPRYKATAWDFYDRLPDVKRIGEARHLYGIGVHAPVWRIVLTGA